MTTGDVVGEGAGSTTPGHSRFYRPELDGLRFFAFFSVFVCHIMPPDPAYYSARHIPGASLLAAASRAGEFGVDLFFVLSAYLITELLLREKDEFGQVHLLSFYVRRILRIWPLYFLGILIAALLSFMDANQPFLLPTVLAFLFLAGNLVAAFVGLSSTIAGPLWSVSLEEQFYLFWPVLIAKARRESTLLRVAAAMFLVAELSRWLLLRYGPHTTQILWCNTVARLDPFALGAVIAVLLRRTPFRLPWPFRITTLLLGGVIWLIAGHYFANSVSFGLLGYPAIALGAGLIFISFLGIMGIPRWLRYPGKISYGLYVFHMLAQYLLLKAHGGYPHNARDYAIFFFASLLLTFVMATLSYHLFEAPFLRLKERFAFVKSRPV